MKEDNSYLIRPIAITVGYMLKVMKSGISTHKFHDEFKNIRHGNYYDFIQLIGEDVPYSVVWHHGHIKADNISKKTDPDFLGLINSEPSLRKFYVSCKKEYGEFTDEHISDKIFQDVALFEISMRMHANNNELLAKKEDLVDVINKLCQFKNLPSQDITCIQQGRKFLNMIKRPKNQFPSWDEGIIALQKAIRTITQHRLTII